MMQEMQDMMTSPSSLKNSNQLCAHYFFVVFLIAVIQSDDNDRSSNLPKDNQYLHTTTAITVMPNLVTSNYHIHTMIRRSNTNREQLWTFWFAWRLTPFGCKWIRVYSPFVVTLISESEFSFA